jgi:hypothetical protein
MQSAFVARARIREASFEDYAGIAALQRQYGLNWKSQKEWMRIWADNPAYIANREKWPIGWVLESTNAGILGYLGNIPIAYELHGKRLLAACSHNWVVDMSARSKSLMLFTHYYKQPSVDLLLTNTAGPTTARTCLAFGYIRAPTGAWDRSDIWVADSKGVASAVLGTFGSRFARIGAQYPLSFALACAGRLSNRHLGSLCDSDVEWCTSFDSRFDQFWEHLRTRTKNLLAVRSREVLEWRFGAKLRSGEAWVLAMCQRARMRAYSIFVRSDNSHGLKRMTLVDFQAIDQDTACLQPMLVCAYRRCARQQVHILESMGFCDRKRASLAVCAPFTRRLQCWRFYYKATDPELAAALENRDLWDPCAFDGDACL